MRSNKILNIKPLGFPWETKDPFLFCVHHRDEYPEGDGLNGIAPAKLDGRNIGNDFTVKDGFRMYHGSHIPGFPLHPHRGFETITINMEGFVDHSDSLGAAGRFGAGDVQWMTAGKGVQHAEMFPMIYEQKENPLEIFQIWLNLPKAGKLVEPHYRMLWKEVIPTVVIKDENDRQSVIKVIAGTLNDTVAPQPTPDSWAANPENGVSVLTIKMEVNASLKLPAATIDGVNRTLYFYKGESISVEGEIVKRYHSIEVDSKSDIILENGSKTGYLLILQGKPINEPVVQYGPFVMNTEEEIKEAYADFRETQFGGWPWPSHEQVHENTEGRFALYADGMKELK
jgi:redox-sensitive bicupin YhaK (pirin superfamily)